MPRNSGCVFCGGAGLTKEHVWPSWLKYVFYMAGPEIVHELLDRNGQLVRLRRSVSLDAQVRRVCGDCNNGWMSRMEDATRPVLEPLIRGEPITLSADHQEVLAKWLTKTGMMLELATHDPTIPSDNYQSFRSRGDPPDFTVVLLSSIADEKGPVLSYMKQDGPLYLRPKVLTDGPLEGIAKAHTAQRTNCYLQTFRLGSFVGQLFWTESTDLARIFEANELSSWHIWAWPNPVAQTWPTTQILDFTLLKAFGERLRLLGNGK